MVTHLREPVKSYLMNTNMTGLDVFQKSLCPCTLDDSSFRIGRLKGTSVSVSSINWLVTFSPNVVEKVA